MGSKLMNRGACAQWNRKLAVFSQANSAPGLHVKDDGAACQKTAAGGQYINARLERPSADAEGAFTVTWQCEQRAWHCEQRGSLFSNNNVKLGWGQPSLDLSDSRAWDTSGSFVDAYTGTLHGTGAKQAARVRLVTGIFQANGTLSLVFRPFSLVYRPGAAGAMAGTLHVCRQGAEPQLIFSGLAHDLVPVACFYDQEASWRVVDYLVLTVGDNP